jgi:DNA-directed RNA polymerase subunit RPC12/RpoP
VESTHSYQKLTKRGERVFCSNCGSEMNHAAKFCQECGDKILFEEVAASYEAHEVSKLNPFFNKLSKSGIITILVIIEFSFLLLLNGDFRNEYGNALIYVYWGIVSTICYLISLIKGKVHWLKTTALTILSLIIITPFLATVSLGFYILATIIGALITYRHLHKAGY